MTAQPSLEALMRLPKVELHCHLEGAVRAQTFLDLTERYGVATIYRPRGLSEEERAARPSAEEVYKFKSFGEFLLTFAAVCQSLHSPGDYARVLREYAQDARSHNVMYAELFVSPSVWRFFHPELNPAETFAELWTTAREIAAEGGPEIRFICDLTRNFGADSAMETARLAVEMQSFGVIGIGLGGDEARFPAELFVDSFDFARRNGLHTVAHAGEAAGAQSVRSAVELLQAQRIGHGIRGLEDDAVIELLIEKDVPLEVCLTSNLRTGVVSSEAGHPLAELDARGVNIVLDTDDPTLFRTDLTAEYAFAERLMGFDAVSRFARNAIEASFAPPPLKATMRERFERASAELVALRRSW